MTVLDTLAGAESRLLGVDLNFRPSALYVSAQTPLKHSLFALQKQSLCYSLSSHHLCFRETMRPLPQVLSRGIHLCGKGMKVDSPSSNCSATLLLQISSAIRYQTMTRRPSEHLPGVFDLARFWPSTAYNRESWYLTLVDQQVALAPTLDVRRFCSA
uniref:Uncharacterized protein n=1 Tax=Coccidioides posadasii RMSCC 3488 TaxID=454284 RepID=A0A0J6FA31_COCPO|nr:hypothetical protein CPAG_03415 [Coccidioides posadasii RMSCC 3488]